MKILAREKTRYNEIYVIQNGGFRELWFKGNGEYYLQSRVDTEGQNPLALVYSRMMMASLLFSPEPKRMLMVGLGGAVVVSPIGPVSASCGCCPLTVRLYKPCASAGSEVNTWTVW